MIYQIANLTGISSDHIVEAWSAVRDPKRKDSDVTSFSGDGIHPNIKGHGEIAQEAFMKMSLSKSYLERQ